jgi:hypothetical protein
LNTDIIKNATAKDVMYDDWTTIHIKKERTKAYGALIIIRNMQNNAQAIISPITRNPKSLILA